jgi:hypothetical protein
MHSCQDSFKVSITDCLRNSTTSTTNGARTATKQKPPAYFLESELETCTNVPDFLCCDGYASPVDKLHPQSCTE